ncbi:hypothetical protein GCM10012290_09730 [Halolactibacillus alkaliphilus]|uniref:Uncharacterized protein n=1 Tax=Halolactibacillus alkaliphilus TaxID=442899 RepID=A0A511WZA5_9BACI|nr:hypothetical protein [Halolactibacillus alkaliphilus]GEN55982.1 hypothetical protein HAL01_04460 [Halolactibacillus alkaliphilus]GGN68266.1 hypothetical protein GCM10012290_09730 [Halolactibacillus alkaliphilus]SFO69351.1 hypothetical protein SAMN05720591_10532 [Halolactibacillus alkaliphilus]
MFQEHVTEIAVNQTFYLSEAIDTLIGVDVEPSRLNQTSEGLSGTLDLTIYYVPLPHEISEEQTVPANTITITDIRKVKEHEASAHFSYPIQLFGARCSEAHLTVYDLDYVLPTRELFTLKAMLKLVEPASALAQVVNSTLVNVSNVQGGLRVNPDQEIDSEALQIERVEKNERHVLDKETRVEEGYQSISNIKHPVVEEVDKLMDSNVHQIKQMNQLDESALVSDETDGARGKEEEEVVKNVVEVAKEAEINERENDVLAAQMRYQQYGLKNLSNPYVKLPCLIVKETIELTAFCQNHKVDLVKIQMVNPHLESSLSSGQVVILPSTE